MLVGGTSEFFILACCYSNALTQHLHPWAEGELCYIVYPLVDWPDITKQYLIQQSTEKIILFTGWRVKDILEKAEEGWYVCECSFVDGSWKQPMMRINKD